MMVVLEMATTAPAYRLSSTDQPNAWPTAYPRNAIVLVSRIAITPTVGPSRSSFRSLNSSPSANIRRMTPSSAKVRTSASSATSGTGRCGPMTSPASR